MFGNNLLSKVSTLQLQASLVVTGLILIHLLIPLGFTQAFDEQALTRKKLEITFTQSFREEFAQQLKNAQSYLKSLPEIQAPKKPAVVFDLDETLMDNRAYFLRYGYYDPQLWEVWVFEENAPALPESLYFYRWLKANNYSVFFITGRKQSRKTATLDNLKRYGITPDGIYFKPNDYDKDSAHNFKTAAREDIKSQGYDIQLVLGDQCSDLPDKKTCGQPIGPGVKLPNPIYQIP